MRTIIHIGQHKTGTTSLQHFLSNNRTSFEEVGLYYPDVVGGIDNPSHFVLSIYALNKDRFSPMKEKLILTKNSDFFLNLKEVIVEDIAKHYKNSNDKKCKDIVWSNEGLYLLNSIEEYDRLLDLFKPFSTEVVCVCCFRELDTYRKSYIQELKKQGLCPSFDKDSYRYIESDSWLFDFDRKKYLLNQVFKKNIFLSYNENDMIGTFLKAIGYNMSGTQSVRLNVS